MKTLSPAELWYIDHDHALNTYTLPTEVCKPLHRPSSEPAMREGLRELGGKELREARPVSTIQLSRTYFAGIEAAEGGQ